MAGDRVAPGRVRKDSVLLTASASMTQSSLPVASLRRLLPPCRCASSKLERASRARPTGQLARQSETTASGKEARAR